MTLDVGNHGRAFGSKVLLLKRTSRGICSQLVPLFHACVVVIARSYTWRGSFLRYTLLKRMFLFGFCRRRCTPPASMAPAFTKTWRKVHDFCWEETLQIMKEDWATEGWHAASVQVLKSGSTYEVTVEYQKVWQDTGNQDHFYEKLWRSPFSTWKPTHVTVLSSPAPILVIGWWYKQPSKEVGELDLAMRQDCHIDEASASSAMLTGDSLSAAAGPVAPPEDIPSESEASSCSSLETKPKRMKMTYKIGRP